MSLTGVYFLRNAFRAGGPPSDFELGDANTAVVRLESGSVSQQPVFEARFVVLSSAGAVTEALTAWTQVPVVTDGVERRVSAPAVALPARVIGATEHFALQTRVMDGIHSAASWTHTLPAGVSAGAVSAHARLWLGVGYDDTEGMWGFGFFFGSAARDSHVEFAGPPPLAVSAPVSAVTVAVPQPSVTVPGALNVTAPVAAVNVTAPPPSMTSGTVLYLVPYTAPPVNISAPVAAVSVTVPAPTAAIPGALSVSAPVSAVSITVPAPSVMSGTVLYLTPYVAPPLVAPVAAVRVTVPQPSATVPGTVSVTAPVAAVSVSVPQPPRYRYYGITVTVAGAGGGAVNISAPVAAVTVTVPQPSATVPGALNVTAPVASVRAAVPAPAAAFPAAVGVTFTAAAVSVTVPQPSAAVPGALNVTTPAVTVRVTVPAHSVSRPGAPASATVTGRRTPLMRATVTLYRRLGESDRRAVWERVEVRGCRVETVDASVASLRGRSAAGGAVVYLPGETAARGFTPRPGDLIVEGETREDMPPLTVQALEASHEVWRVTGVEAHRGHDGRVRHLEVACS